MKSFIIIMVCVAMLAGVAAADLVLARGFFGCERLDCRLMNSTAIRPPPLHQMEPMGYCISTAMIR